MVGARRKASTLIGDSFGVYPLRNMKHGPIPLQRSLLEEVEKRWPEDFEATKRSRSRSSDDLLVCWLHHNLGYLLGRAQPSSIKYDYLLVGSDSVTNRLETIMKERGIDCFCLNDSETAASFDEARRSSVASILERIFPIVSPAEVVS